jgi:hypothetical protein
MKPVAKAETTIFSDGFESGTFLTTDIPPGAWTSLAMGGGGDSATITTDSPHNGSYNAEFIAASESWSCVKKSFAEVATAFVRAYYTFSTLPGVGERVYLTELRGNNGGVGVSIENVSGNLFWILTVSEGGTYTTYEAAPSNPITGIPYCIELKRDIANGLEQLWIDGVSKGVNNVSMAVNSTEIVIGYGYNTATEQTCYVDCVVVADAYIGPEFSDSIPPTFTNISTNTTKTGQSCSFNCLVNDDTNVSAYTFSTNNTGAWVNDTVTIFSHFINATAAWANVTKTLNATFGNLACYMWYANDTSNNWSKSGQFNLTLVRMSYYLVVSSPYGAPTPASGWFDAGTDITASVISPVAGPIGTRYVCNGWTGTGDVPASGTGLSARFTITQNSSITWNWKTQHLLTTLTYPDGLIPQPSRDPVGEAESSNSWWYDDSASVHLTAQIVDWHTFNYWTADGASQGSGVNPITIDIDAPHTAVAYYSLSDVTKPEIIILSPENKTYYTASISLEFTINETASWIGYSIDNQANITITGNTTFVVEGSHSLILYANDTVGNMGSSNMVYFTARTGVSDIAILSVHTSRTVVGQGYSLSINVTVENQGDYLESSNVTLYGNAAVIGTRENIILPKGSRTILTFTWNTSGFAKGNYIISAYAWPVPGETDTEDNTCIEGVVTVTIPGDVDGDFNVDIFDAVQITSRYGKIVPPVPPDSNADIDGNGVVNIFDVVICTGNYGKKWP